MRLVVAVLLLSACATRGGERGEVWEPRVCVFDRADAQGTWRIRIPESKTDGTWCGAGLEIYPQASTFERAPGECTSTWTSDLGMEVVMSARVGARIAAAVVTYSDETVQNLWCRVQENALAIPAPWLDADGGV